MTVAALQPATEKWLAPNYDAIPALLRQHDRWLEWTLNGEGRKVPRAVAKPHINVNAHNPNYWCGYDNLLNAKEKLHGPGFVLGSVVNGPTFSGIDLDHCRDRVTGVIQEWARAIIRFFNSYTEISPSGTGVKIFVTGALRSEDAQQGKVYQLEIYDRRRYFTVTGHHLSGTPLTVEPREAQLRDLYARQQSQDLVELVKLFGLHLRDRGSWIDITCPWSEDHHQADHPGDAALHLDEDGQVDGFECFHASHQDKKLPDVLKLFGIKQAASDFITSKNGVIVANNQANIGRALAKMDVSLLFDAFSLKPYITRHGVTQPFEDAFINSVWLEMEPLFGFLPTKDFFYDVVQNTAWKHHRHPVLEYLARVKWDGTPRLDTWLTTYGKA